MQNIRFEGLRVNSDALSTEVASELKDVLFGISTGSYGVIVHLSDDATPEQINRVRQIVQNHDPSVLTAEQQARIERQQKLEQVRSENGADLDVSAYDGEAALIQQMAQKIAWLEQEMQEMRG